jgi:hypothetical protein
MDLVGIENKVERLRNWHISATTTEKETKVRSDLILIKTSTSGQNIGFIQLV